MGLSFTLTTTASLTVVDVVVATTNVSKVQIALFGCLASDLFLYDRFLCCWL
jgi:hypothetical protein